MPKYFFIFLFLFFVFVQTNIAQASDIFISEFLIEPNQSIELYNSSENVVDISNWYLDDNGGTTFFTIPTNTMLYPNSCIVLTDNFYLNKSSPDTVRLFDKTDTPISTNAKLIDNVQYDKSYGENISFQKTENNIWITQTNNLGLNNLTKTNCVLLPTPTPTLLPTPTPTTLPTPTAILTLTPTPTNTPTINNVFISEVMPNPESGSFEWVELYNANEYEINLENWCIDDVMDAGATPKKFSTKIAKFGFITIEVSSSGFLNNSGDYARLLDSTKNEKDSVEYSNAIEGKSYSKQIINSNSNNWCFTNPSMNQKNNSCENISQAENLNTISNIPTLKNITKNTTIDKNKTIPTNKLNKNIPLNTLQNKKRQNINFNPVLYFLPLKNQKVLGLNTQKIKTAKSNNFFANLILNLSIISLFISFSLTSYSFYFVYKEIKQQP